MRRVVVTGLGMVSCLGNDKATVTESLRNGTSGITRSAEYEEMGLRSLVRGRPEIDIKEHIDRKVLRFMGEGSAWAYIAMGQAIADAGLEESDVSNVRTGIIAGSGGPSVPNLIESIDTLRAKGVKRIGPYRVTQTMSSTISACLATPYKIKGFNYSLSSACATSAHCVGNAMELIQMGKQDVVFAGGGEEEHWSFTCLFDAMGALSTKYNDTPTEASRPYDANRDGFVIAGGAGMLVLEELEHAKARGAKIYAEVTGYGATSDGYDMVAPSGEGAVRCMQMAMDTTSGPVDYINSHGTSTPAGDMQELKAIHAAYPDGNVPLIGSTKSLAGHSLGATGGLEAIFSLLMMENNFVAASANIQELDPDAGSLPIVQTRKDNVTLNRVMSNSFGFGGTNASLVFDRFSD